MFKNIIRGIKLSSEQKKLNLNILLNIGKALFKTFIQNHDIHKLFQTFEF